MKPYTRREHRERRHIRIRAAVKGTADRPRLAVFRSNRWVWVQLIDDTAGRTLAAATDFHEKKKSAKKADDSSAERTRRGTVVGTAIAKRAGELKIERAVFDRGGYRYHGMVRAIAEGARSGGLQV
ncbi:MAG: 50S ribosomal protein L18 [bacterium]|nr:50S ribosomal protein L18 [bacterium]MDZ4299453.1 50S ribosomal protein L18 [Candidatus Sungbacteria bacterium]